MALTLTCHRCGVVLTADDVDELARLGEAHAREHGHRRPLTRAHVLARIRRQNRRPC